MRGARRRRITARLSCSQSAISRSALPHEGGLTNDGVMTRAPADSGRRFDFCVFLHRASSRSASSSCWFVAASFWSPSFLDQARTCSNVRSGRWPLVRSASWPSGCSTSFSTRGIEFLSVGSIAALGSVLSAYFIAFSGYSVPRQHFAGYPVRCGMRRGDGVFCRLSETAILRDVAGDDGDRARPRH